MFSHLLETEPLSKVPLRADLEIRYLTFNVNGVKTLFSYHPWNALQQSYDAFFSVLGADIVTLQEIKILPEAVVPMGLVKDYRAFVSLPKAKKGYSGVGLFVREPKEADTENVKQALTVVKAEEGISGRLRGGDGKKTPYCLLPSEQSIGGYLTAAELAELDLDEDYMCHLDSEGRCAVVELANNTVVFGLYCPANSMGTEEGETFRLCFHDVLFRRCRKLRDMGKTVVVMGDINVSMDLIDNAESINDGIKSKAVQNNLKDGGEEFEKLNEIQCSAYRTSNERRTLLNHYTFSTLLNTSPEPSQFLYDTTRRFQGRRLAMYTVWNTMTSSRQSNYGSRIDLILVSDEKMADNVVRADILNYLNGSDHCPVYTDVDVSYQELVETPPPTKLAFEAKAFFKLVKHRDISQMFGAISTKRRMEEAKEEELKKLKVQYVSRKKQNGQQSIKNFFFNDRATAPSPPCSDSPSLPSQSSDDTSAPMVKLDSIDALKSLLYSDPPKCHHQEPCLLRTSLTKASKGKKFWVCARLSKGNTAELGEHRCDFFEWAKLKGST